jgi:hypothetical protein
MDRINSPARLFEQREDSNDFGSHIRVQVRWELIGQVDRQRAYLRSRSVPVIWRVSKYLNGLLVSAWQSL